MSNETIIYSIQNGQDNEGCLMLELYNNNIGIINKVCNRLNVPEDLREDIKQEFFIWLSGAVNSFDFKSDNKFSSYLFVYVRGQILRFMENQNICKIPSYKCQEINKYKREFNILSQILLREPTDKELAAFMSIPLTKIIELKKDLSSFGTKSLNDIVTEEGNERQDFIPDKENQIESLCDSLDVEYRNKELWNLVEEESKRKRKDIIEYYNGIYKGDRRTLQKDIYRTVKNLRKQPGRLKKLEILSEYNFYRVKSIRAFQRNNSSIVEDLAILMYESED